MKDLPLLLVYISPYLTSARISGIIFGYGHEAVVQRQLEHKADVDTKKSALQKAAWRSTRR
jgi:hypothetical protein